MFHKRWCPIYLALLSQDYSQLGDFYIFLWFLVGLSILKEAYKPTNISGGHRATLGATQAADPEKSGQHGSPGHRRDSVAIWA